VKEAVREFLRVKQEVFIAVDPSAGRGPGGFWVCVGEGFWGVEEGRFFCDGATLLGCLFVMAFERECTESYWAGHVEALEYFGVFLTASATITAR